MLNKKNIIIEILYKTPNKRQQIHPKIQDVVNTIQILGSDHVFINLSRIWLQQSMSFIFSRPIFH